MGNSKRIGLTQSETAEVILNFLHMLNHEIRNYRERRKKIFNLTGSQMALIDILSQNPGINLHDLSEKMKMARSNTSVIVEQLVNKGIVLRKIPEENRRSVRLSLQPDFLEKYIEMKCWGEYWLDMTKNATDEEILTAIRGLEKCLEIIQGSKHGDLIDEVGQEEAS